MGDVRLVEVYEVELSRCCVDGKCRKRKKVGKMELVDP